MIGADAVRTLSTKAETPSQQAYRAIWGGLLNRFREVKPGATNRSGSKSSWQKIPIGLGGAHLKWNIHGLNKKDGWYELGLHLESKDREKNLTPLEFLSTMQKQLESVVDEKLLFEEWGTIWAHIYMRRETEEINEEVKEWAVDRMVRFYDAVNDLGFVESLRKLGW